MQFRGFLRSARPTLAHALSALTIAIAATGFVATAASAGATSTSISSTQSQSVYGEKVGFTATVSGSGPSGKVTFKDRKDKLAAIKAKTIGVGSPLHLGYEFTCALTAAGGVQCWGENGNGELGDGTTTDRTTPGPVSGLPGGVRMIAGGEYHTCALTGAGVVVCWGSNQYGQLGDGTMTDRLSPVPVSGISGDIVAIAGGAYHTCAVKKSGAALCWGRNNHGQIGNGTMVDSLTPVAVSGLGKGVAAMAAGESFTCALTDAGAVRCWGENTNGQLGDGTTVDRNTPVPVSKLRRGVVSVIGGRYHACALTRAGAVKCWGLNSDGQLGNGSTTERHKPYPVSGLSADAVAISNGGGYHVCAIDDGGAVRCWGYNSDGQLGDGTTNTRLSPFPIPALPGDIALVAGGIYHTCVLTRDGAAKCMGSNNAGQLGDGSTTGRLLPVNVTGFGSHTAMVSGEALYRTKKLDVGKHRISAHYAGNASNSSSTSTKLLHEVKKGKTRIKKIEVKPKNPKTGDRVRLKVKVKAKKPSTAEPRGKAVIKDGKKRIGTVKIKKGKAGIRLGKLKKGKHKLKVTYKGNKNWKGDRATKKVKVEK